MMRITLLGACKIIASDGTDVTPRARKTRGMIAYLALAPGGSATRERLAGLLWSDRQEEQARGSLRQSVTELRAAFSGEDEDALRIDRDSIQLRLDATWVDARELERLAAASIDERRQVIQIYGGDLLADLGSIGGPFEDWLYTDRAFRRETALSCMASVLRDRLGAGDIADAEAVARSVLGLEVAHEEAHRTIMEAYARRGDKASALRQFQTCTDTLKRVLDAKPAPATVALYDRIKADRLEAVGEGLPVPAPVHVEPGAATASAESPRAAQLSVAVLPFRNVGGDPGSDYLGEGLADEIADGLSRFKWLSVIASGTTGVARGAESDPRETGRRLGVRYSVEGTVRRGGDRVRIAVRLVDCEDAHAVWAESRIVELGNMFDVQDEIVREVVGRLDPKLMQAEIERVRRRPPDNRNAYDCVLRAVPLLYKASAESFEQAGHLLQRAVALYPDYARAHA